jgi:hypothetical protein
MQRKSNSIFLAEDSFYCGTVGRSAAATAFMGSPFPGELLQRKLYGIRT